MDVNSSVLIHSPIEGHLCCFLGLAALKETAINICVHTAIFKTDNHQGPIV